MSGQTVDLPPPSYRTLYGQHIIQDYHKQLTSHDSQWQEKVGDTVGMIPADQKKICIIGAGAAGLYAAMMLSSLNLDFDILEASDRVGGRLFTYQKFPNASGKYDYYDVGAMRFPDTPYMWRTFDLIDKKLKDQKLRKLPYQFAAPFTFLYYNGIRYQRGATPVGPPPGQDVFHVADTAGGNVPTNDIDYVKLGHEALVDDALQPFRTALQRNAKQGMKFLMSCDKYSTRSYMSLSPTLQYPDEVINWLETMDKSTGWYDRALAETVLESMAFDYPTSGPNPEPVKWYCIDGGSQRIAEAMRDKLISDKAPAITYGRAVTAISINENGTLRVTAPTDSPETEPRDYAHVISSIPLPCLRTLDLDGCNLDYATKNALRELQYGPSIKIGIKFTENWWEKRFGIIGGQSYTDLPMRTIVYPSYGPEGPKSSVLIVSYCWTEDALRNGALMTGPGTAGEKKLLNLIFHDLAAVHGVEEKEIRDLFDEVSYFPFDWYHDPLTMGAFAFFGPGQFKNIFPHVTKPAAGDCLHFIGEATSTNHAWVAGALDSAWRGVYEVVQASYDDKMKEFLKLWPRHPTDSFTANMLDIHIKAGKYGSPGKEPEDNAALRNQTVRGV